MSAGTLTLSGSWNVGSGTATTAVASGATLNGTGIITATTLADSGAGTVNLTGANLVVAISSSGTIGAFAFTNAQSLSVASMNATSVTVQTSGATSDLTLSTGTVLTASGTGTPVTLAAGRNFINNAGSGAISLTGIGSPRWLIYSTTPGADAFGNLNSGNTAIWNTTYGGTISQSGARYVFSYTPTLTFTSVNDSKTYGTNATAAVASDYTVSGFQAGVSNAYLGDSSATAYSGAPSVTSSGSSTSAQVTGSPYVINVAAGTLAATSGYALAYNSTGTLTVNPAALTITANNQSMTYGGTMPTLTASYSGFVNGDTNASLTTAPTVSSATPATANAGTYNGTLTASGAVDNNYTISYAAGNLTIGKAALTITANNQSRTYGDANPVLTYSVGGSGLINGDVLTGQLSSSATTASSVGNYAINQGTLSNPNYLISFAGATLSIDPRSISVVANPQSRIYGNINPALSYIVGGAGLANGDALSGSLTTAATSVSGIGNYAISQGSLSASSNYTMAYVGNTLSVIPRPITVTANAVSKSSGTVNPTLTYAIGGAGLVNGDTLYGSLTTAANQGSPVGTYAITQGSLVASSNYALQFYGNNLTVIGAVLPVAQYSPANDNAFLQTVLAYMNQKSSLDVLPKGNLCLKGGQGDQQLCASAGR